MSKLEVALPLLQSQIKSDPDVFQDEFDRQFRHFESLLTTFTDPSAKPDDTFTQLTMFLAHTSPCYNGFADRLSQILLSFLGTNIALLHSTTRKSLVTALLILRSSNKIPLISSSGVGKQMQVTGLISAIFSFFENSTDKELRKMVFVSLVKDIARTHNTPSATGYASLRSYLFGRMSSTDTEHARKAISIVIELYRRRAWADNKTVNAVAQCCLSKVNKVSLAAAHFLMCNQGPAESIIESSDDDVARVQAARKAVLVASNRKGSKKKLKKVREAVEKSAQKKKDRKSALDSAISFAAIDVLNDPQGLAEKVLRRVTSKHEAFAFRLPMLTLLSRLIGRHQLQLPNFYTYTNRFLSPKQTRVTSILAAIAQSCHEHISPEDLKSTVTLIVEKFCSEHLTAEVVVVGLNTLREIASRNHLALTQELLDQTLLLRSYKNKDVQNTLRALINLYREIYPSLLHKNLRGKEGQTNVIAGEDAKPEFGRFVEGEALQGARFFADFRRKSAALKLKRQSAVGHADGEGGQESETGEAENEDGDVSGEVSEADNEEDSGDEEDSVEESVKQKIQKEEKSEDEKESVNEYKDKKGKCEESEDADSETSETTAGGDVESGAVENGAVESGGSREPATEFDLTTHFLSDKDFQAIRKLEALHKAEAATLGRKRARAMMNDEESFRNLEDAMVEGTDSDSSDESEIEISESEANNSVEKMTPAAQFGTDGIDPESLRSRTAKKRKLTNQRAADKKANAKEYGHKVKSDKVQSVPNAVKARNKPFAMVRQNRLLREKKQVDCQTKASKVQTHIRNLKKDTGGKKKFRKRS
eukprot:Lankesteria_metandrocarpae@DN4271_c0_g1_i1.p1